MSRAHRGDRLRLPACLAAACLAAAGCGDALSSLDSVQRSAREQYSMQVAPDYVRRGEGETFQLTLPEDLVSRLAAEQAYPIDLDFGPGTALRTFDASEPSVVQAEVLISPLADEGEREPVLVYSLADGEAEARGRFWILPALQGPNP